MHFLIPCFVLDFTSTGALPLRCLFKSSGLLLVWFWNVLKGLLGTAKLQKVLKKQMKKSLFRTAKIYLLGGLVGCYLGASGVPLVCFLNASCVLFGRFMGTSVVALGCFWGTFWVLF